MARRKHRDEQNRRKRRAPGPAAVAVVGEVSAEDRVMDQLGFDRDAFLRDHRDVALEAIEGDRSAQGIGRAITRVADAAEDVLRSCLQVLPPDPPIACGEGCAHCCLLLAEVRPAEALYMAAHLRAVLSADRLDAVRAKVVAVARRVRGMDKHARAEARIPCSLLEEERCSVYEARPFACRACNSSSAADCEAALGDAKVTTIRYAPQSALYHYAGAALLQALDVAGLHHERMELNTALAVALSTPDAAERWLAGEPVFRDVASHAIFD
jgi:hypothetical protein